MSDFLTSLARTYAAKIIGGLAGLAAALGIAVPADLSDQATVALAALLVLAAQMAYYAAARALEQRHPGAGRLLLAARPPHYSAEEMPVRLRPVIDRETVETELLELQERVRQHVQRTAEQTKNPGTRPGGW